MPESDPIIGTSYGTRVQVEAKPHAEAKQEARRAEAEQAQRDFLVAKHMARVAYLANPGATEELMMPDFLDEDAVAAVVAKQALESDLVDLAPAHGSKGATHDKID